MGLSRAQAAGRIGITAALLRRIEEGELITKYDVRAKLATF
jgi:ribosome-binding protein aMBF1 (putative translation factor)